MMLRGVGRAPLSSATGHLNLRPGATDSLSNRSRGRTITKVAGGVSLPPRLKPVKPAGRHDFRSFSARQVDQQAASTSRREGEGEDAAVSGTGTTVLLEVAGMRCGGCSANVKKRLLEHLVSFGTKRSVGVRFDKKKRVIGYRRFAWKIS